MVRQPIDNREGPVDLLSQNQAHQLVRQGEPPKGNLRVGAFQNFRTQSQRTPNDKGDVTVPIGRQLIDLLSKLLRAAFLPLDR